MVSYYYLRESGSDYHSFFIIACHSCGITQWNTQLMTWNARRMDPTGPDRNFLLCGVCLNRFKHHKEFCTLCYKLYSDSPVLSQLEEQRKLLSEEAIKESGCSSCALGNDAADEQWMVSACGSNICFVTLTIFSAIFRFNAMNVIDGYMQNAKASTKFNIKLFPKEHIQFG